MLGHEVPTLVDASKSARAALAGFRPDCVILDPWNAAAKDDKQRDYSEKIAEEIDGEVRRWLKVAYEMDA